MQYFYVEPEVAGGLGRNTMMDRTVHPPVVIKLHYHVEGWLGDALLESFPAFIVTREAKKSLQEAGVTGARFDQVEVTTSEEFEELYSKQQLPEFYWLRVEGKATDDDLGTAPDGRLVVSERALEVLRRAGIANALVSPFGS